jgi:hypothetical protein
MTYRINVAVRQAKPAATRFTRAEGTPNAASAKQTNATTYRM